MKNLSVMINPASSLCNLRCKYCFYADVASLREVRSFGVMEERTMMRMLQTLESGLEPGDRITLAFQGGEPVMAGLDYFRRLVSVVDRWDKRIHVEYALQTNATLLDEAWCRFLAEHDFLVGVSYDILRDCHDDARVDASGAGTSRRVEQSMRLLAQCGARCNVLCTLTNAVARHPKQVWKQIQRHDLRYIQFTPCLDELESPGHSPYALTPERFSAFYCELFLQWCQELRAGRYRSIKLFDDIVGYCAYGVPTACGMGGRCQPQLIVEADGSVYPCDFYCLDTYRLGSMVEQDLQTLLTAPAMRAFHMRAHTQPALCQDCEFQALCGGGCRRMQRETCCGENDSFCGYRAFLKASEPTFRRIARGLTAAQQRHS